MNKDPEDFSAGDEESALEGRWMWVVRCEEVLFLLILLALIVAGLLPIAARFFNLPSILWLDDLSQQMVLWTALFGAGAATRDRKPIDINVLGRFLPPRGRLFLRAVMQLLAAVLCGVLVPIACSFASDEAEFAGEAETFLELCGNWLPAVIPLGLGLLTLRLFLAAVIDSRRAFVADELVGPKDRGLA